MDKYDKFIKDLEERLIRFDLSVDEAINKFDRSLPADVQKEIVEITKELEKKTEYKPKGFFKTFFGD